MAPLSLGFRARSRRSAKRASARRAALVTRRRAQRPSRSLSLVSRSDQIHRFAKCLATPVTLTNASTTFNFEPTLASLAGYADITALFDMYRITGWEITFLPTRNTADASAGLTGAGGFVGSTPNGNIPFMWLANDTDGGGPTSEAQFYEKPTSRVFMCDKPIKWVCKSPRISSAAYAGGAFTGYSVAPSTTWIDCSSTGVPYYGTYGLQTFGTTYNGYIMGYCKVYLEAKGIR